MSSVWNKIDSGLSSIYSNYLRAREGSLKDSSQMHPVVAAGGRLVVTMIYTGDLAEIEPLGFLPNSLETPGLATGAIDLANLEQLAAHSAVLKMSYGLPKRLTLDKSIPDISANQVWQRSGQTFSGLTGAGVIVGIIDTGVDIHHPFLRKMDPPKTTRILRIWDQGLEPESGDTQPDPTFLSGGGKTYGVEYDVPKIMAAIGGLGNFRHRDCSGHGTHVASIAVGNGSDKFQYIGVAPEADLIIVKNFYLLTHPKIDGDNVDPDKLFRDAVTYILNTAKEIFDRPVVINYSAGANLGAHDGFSVEEDFLTNRFDGSTGRCFVTVSGNDASTFGDEVKEAQHAKIEFSAGGGEIEVAFYLKDVRKNRLEYNLCKGVDDTDSLFIELFYPDGPAEISCALKVPLGPTGFPGGFVPGPTFGAPDKVEKDFGVGQHFSMEHSMEEDILVFTGRGTVKRRKFEIRLDPFEKQHLADFRYLLKVKTDSELTIHVWCQQPTPEYLLRVLPDPGVPELIIEDLFQINQPGGAKGVITVAGYDTEEPELPVIFFSSRGPLVDYGGAPPQPSKPTVAAPGRTIDAARSRDAWPQRKKKHLTTQPLNGTSMSAPHVAGAVALLMQKDSTMSTLEITQKLLDHARRPSSETPDEALKRGHEFGAGRLNVKAAVDDPT